MNQDIGDLIISKQSELINAILKETIDGGGTAEELLNAYYIAFLDSWNQKPLLELVAKKCEVRYATKWSKDKAADAPSC